MFNCILLFINLLIKIKTNYYDHPKLPLLLFFYRTHHERGMQFFELV
jgi:hypothetical protein